MPIEVKAATHRDIPACAQILGEAFADDPVMAELWPDPQRRHAVLVGYFDVSIRHHHIHGGGVQLAVEGDRAVGVSDWDPPGHYVQPLARTVRAAPSLAWLFRDRLRHALRVRQTLDRHAPREPFWYLAHIGTTVDARGAGAAVAMLAHRLAEIDAAGQSAYLVCTRAETVPFYERFGFHMREEFRLSDRGATVFGMDRAPQRT